MNDLIQRLEEKIAYLERHVVEQDKAMLEFAEDLARLRREVGGLRARTTELAEEVASDEPVEERPPHY
ncbi:MAG TPA: SlyX family protein [Opitutus sp.]|nr:SlyX family protein [Opitutus sp.]